MAEESIFEATTQRDGEICGDFSRVGQGGRDATSKQLAPRGAAGIERDRPVVSHDLKGSSKMQRVIHQLPRRVRRTLGSKRERLVRLPGLPVNELQYLKSEEAMRPFC